MSNSRTEIPASTDGPKHKKSRDVKPEICREEKTYIRGTDTDADTRQQREEGLTNYHTGSEKRTASTPAVQIIGTTLNPSNWVEEACYHDSII